MRIDDYYLVEDVGMGDVGRHVGGEDRPTQRAIWRAPNCR